MSTAAFFHNSPNQKEPKCPPTGEWINKLCNIHLCNGILLSKKKKERITHIGFNMDKSQNYYAE